MPSSIKDLRNNLVLHFTRRLVFSSSTGPRFGDAICLRRRQRLRPLYNLLGVNVQMFAFVLSCEANCSILMILLRPTSSSPTLVGLNRRSRSRVSLEVDGHRRLSAP
jgi:hypothetical protein